MIAKSLHKVNEMLSISEILSLVQITKKAQKKVVWLQKERYEGRGGLKIILPFFPGLPMLACAQRNPANLVHK